MNSKPHELKRIQPFVLQVEPFLRFLQGACRIRSLSSFLDPVAETDNGLLFCSGRAFTLASARPLLQDLEPLLLCPGSTFSLSPFGAFPLASTGLLSQDPQPLLLCPGSAFPLCPLGAFPVGSACPL